MKKLSFLIVLIAIFSGVAFAQNNEAVEQRQWCSIGEVDAQPDACQFGIVIKDLARLPGLVRTTDGSICRYAGVPLAGDQCTAAVTLVGPGGAADTHLMDGSDILITEIGIDTLAGNYFWDLTNGEFIAWDGDTMNSDAIAITTRAPYVGALGHVYNIDDDDWGRTSAEVADGADIPAARVAIHTFAMNVVWDGGDWKNMGADANGDLTVNQTTATPGYGRIQDGDGTTLADVIDAFADGLGVDHKGLMTGAVMYGFDGAGLNKVRLGAVDEVQMTDVATRPGEDAGNFWRDIMKAEIAVDAPAKTAGTVVDDAGGGTLGDIVLASTYTLNNPNWCVTIKNAGGGAGDVLVNAILYVSPSGAAGEWESLTWTTCDTLDVGDGTCSFCCSNCAYAYVKGEALCGLGDDTTVDAFYTANKN